MINTLVNMDGQCTKEYLEHQTGDFFNFLKNICYQNNKARVIVIDELGVTAEMNLSDLRLELSPYEPVNVTLDCFGPITLHYPEGVEKYNG